ncbi:hypothetical protein QBC46DRAFT_359014 [Diplogelasinospora grovesii]|uniref:NAD-dependent epimerase/dehydratase domain-containing protein n=1 Tax=Diplogelasinospora grovesii TaxID=303347 RepID=A0AAN6MX03_9PEZI|nr:hypothetical protein QBC46DRAFT_359014 [Diplogelasinospora grovesii]
MTRVLLTGGSGFVASHVLDILLAHGHSVVTTVRSQQKADKIKEAHPQYGKDLLDFAIVEDIAEPDAFAKAVISNPPFEAVIHTASPFHFNVTDVQKQLLDPAIVGTTSILHAIKKSAPTVKKVVITSSFAALLDLSKGNWPEHTYWEADWNPITLEAALKHPHAGYQASKTFAEKAAWDFLENEKPNFTVSTIAPPLVFGPVMKSLSSLSSLNTSNQFIQALIMGHMKGQMPNSPGFLWVDVRDVALAHVKAMEQLSGAADNKRFFVVAGHFNTRQVVDAIRRNFPEYSSALPDASLQGGDFPEGGLFKVDNRRSVEVLGLKYRPLEDSVVDTVRSLKALGA